MAFGHDDPFLWSSSLVFGLKMVTLSLTVAHDFSFYGKGGSRGRDVGDAFPPPAIIKHVFDE